MKIRMLLLLFVISAILLAACAPEPLQDATRIPTAQTPPPESTGRPEPSNTPASTPEGAGSQQDLPQAAVEARRQLADRLNIGIDQVTVIGVEEAQWPDGCLGLAQPDEMCTEMIVEGYQVLLETGGKQYRFHTDQDGTQVREAQEIIMKGEFANLPAVRNAMQFLAQELKVPLDAITLQDIKEVDWPDSCLGVARKGQLCMQVITPGYRILFNAGQKTYEVHTDRAGGAIVLAPEPAAIEDASITWEQVENGTCRKISILGSVLEYGDCQGPMMIGEFSELRMKEWQELAATFKPFVSETETQNVKFEGQGDQAVSQSEERSMAEWARLVYDEAESGRSGVAWGSVLVWHREGGIAGFCDDLVIYSSGWAYASSCKQSNTSEQKGARLTADQLEQLYRWVDELKSFEISQKDSAAADAMTIAITFSGTGDKTQDLETEQMMNTLAQDLYFQISRQSPRQSY